MLCHPSVMNNRKGLRKIAENASLVNLTFTARLYEKMAEPHPRTRAVDEVHALQPHMVANEE